MNGREDKNPTAFAAMHRRTCTSSEMAEDTYDDAILPNLDMVPDGRSLDDGVRAYVDVISYLHGIIVEVSAISLIWRSAKESA